MNANEICRLIEVSFLRDALSRIAAEESRARDFAYVCPAGTLIRTLEEMKKSGCGLETLRISKGLSAFHNLCDCGEVLLWPLTNESLSLALFERDSWDSPVTLDSDVRDLSRPPEHSIDLIVLKHFDQTFDADLALQYGQRT